MQRQQATNRSQAALQTQHYLCLHRVRHHHVQTHDIVQNADDDRSQSFCLFKLAQHNGFYRKNEIRLQSNHILASFSSFRNSRQHCSVVGALAQLLIRGDQVIRGSILSSQISLVEVPDLMLLREARKPDAEVIFNVFLSLSLQRMHSLCIR